MKRTPLKRKTPLRAKRGLRNRKATIGSGSRSRYLKKGTPVKPVNPTRRKREFARCYGSKERVAFVKMLPCVARTLNLMGDYGCPLVAYTDNAHTVTGGKGRKADANTIVPLCREHHERYDQHRAPFDTTEARDKVKAYAAEVERLWRDYR